MPLIFVWTMVFCMLTMFSFAASEPAQASQGPSVSVMPMPASVAVDQGVLKIDSLFSITFTGQRDERLDAATARFMQNLTTITGIPLVDATPGRKATLEIECKKLAGKVQQVIEDESYTLAVTPTGARLMAATPYGVLHGLETLLQLVHPGADGFALPAVRIQDQPRFPWRGLLVDVCRHWMPMDVVKRTLDAMAAVKMNVLHWHLSEDQGFRVESKLFPKLHQMGSDGKYFTQDQIREVVRYAADRGIRVVPEFDMPGHSTSWLVGYPELASMPHTYTIERGYGIFDPTMDPTRESTYKFIDSFIGEMVTLFPDAYFHIGGDEVTGKQWDSSATIAQFKSKHGMKDNHDLQAYFNKRVSVILQKHGKKMVGWDEILHPDLPRDIVVQSWRGQKSLAQSAAKGYTGILSYGYYLDHMQSAAWHYRIDPIDADAAALPADAQQRILGGEACMWAELITPENIDNRLWPRNAVVAERLWSPATLTDTTDMYRRLAAISRHLTLLGNKHEVNQAIMLERVAGADQMKPLTTLASVLEPTKFYTRHAGHKYRIFTALNRMVDIVSPESDRARQFNAMVETYIADPSHQAHRDTLASWLQEWKDNHAQVQPLLQHSGVLAEVLPLSEALSAAASAALDALGTASTTTPRAADDATAQIIERAMRPQAELLIAVAPGIKRLVEQGKDK